MAEKKTDALADALAAMAAGKVPAEPQEKPDTRSIAPTPEFIQVSPPGQERPMGSPDGPTDAGLRGNVPETRAPRAPAPKASAPPPRGAAPAPSPRAPAPPPTPRAPAPDAPRQRAAAPAPPPPMRPAAPRGPSNRAPAPGAPSTQYGQPQPLDDDAMIAPAAPVEYLGHVPHRPTGRVRGKTTNIKRTFIPIWLTGALLSFVFGLLHFMGDEDSAFRQFPLWMSGIMFALGLMLLGMAIWNMVSVKTELARDAAHAPPMNPGQA